MVIIADYTIKHKCENVYYVESHVTPCCPVCGEPLVYRDSCRRIGLSEGREIRIYIIRRFKCSHCHRLHRELPDFMVPYKQYESEEISGTLDGIVTPEDEDSEDYPCKTTMTRWNHWLESNRLRIDGYLKSIGYRQLGYSDTLLNSGVSLLEQLRKSTQRWLEVILRIIYNSGGFLVPT